MNCWACGKEMWSKEYDGLIVIVDGDPRCEECKEANKAWSETYTDTK